MIRLSPRKALLLTTLARIGHATAVGVADHQARQLAPEGHGIPGPELPCEPCKKAKQSASRTLRSLKRRRR